MTDSRNEMKIGRFTISLLEFGGARPDELWIDAGGGEGGTFKLEDFEKAVESFYNEHF